MNPFLKAGMFTLIVVALALLVIFQFDSLRAGELKKNLEQVAYEQEARQVITHYTSVMGSSATEQCPYIQELRQTQFDSIYPLARKMKEYEARNMLNSDYESLKNTYLVGLADMYITGFEDKKTCNASEVQLAFFYPEKTSCPRCGNINSLLSTAAEKCRNVRIYAFPYDSQIAPLKLIANRYNVGAVPALVINDGGPRDAATLGAAELITNLKENGAQCS